MNIQEVKNSEWGLSIKEYGGIVEGYDDINQCIHLILTTVPGSVPGDPLFGCGIWGYVDKNVGRAVNVLVKLIADSLAAYEPRINVTQISYLYQTLDKGAKSVKFFIKWTTSVKRGSDLDYQVINANVQGVPDGFNYTFDFTIVR